VPAGRITAPPPGEATVALRLRGVSVVRDGRALLDDLAWEVRAPDRWVILGPNGSGKTTLLQVVGARLWPTRGEVEILGHRLGRVDLRTLRPRVALVSGSVIRQLRASQTVREVVVSGRFGALETWWDHYDDADWALADRLLADAGVGGEGGIGDREFGVISEGERQHVLLARALMSRPDLLLLDEPAAGLDMGARERLLASLASLAADPQTPPIVLVTHHAEEIPTGMTHAALLRAGRFLAAGEIGAVLRSDAVSACFDVAVSIGQESGRWWSRAVPDAASSPGDADAIIHQSKGARQ
jgi:iron complex transport system ATP-binding protein